jgi:hypothetical protein
VLTYWWEPFGDEFVGWWLVFYYGMPFFGMAFPRDPNVPDHWRRFMFPTPEETSGHAPQAPTSAPPA